MQIPAPDPPPVARTAGTDGNPANSAGLPVVIPVDNPEPVYEIPDFGEVEPSRALPPALPPAQDAPVVHPSTAADDDYAWLIKPQDDPNEPRAPSLRQFHCDPLPPEALDAAVGLGKPLASLHIDQVTLVVGLVFTGVHILAGLAFILSFTLVLKTGFAVNRVLGSPWLLPGGLICSGAGVALVLVWMYRMRACPPAVLWLCPGGLIWQRSKAIGSCRWDEIRAFHAKTTRITEVQSLLVWRLWVMGISWRYEYEVIGPEGDEFRLDSNHQTLDAKPIGQYIQQQTTRALLPVYRRLLERGETIDFGPFAMNRHALAHGGRNIPWRALRWLEVSRGKVLIFGRGERLWAEEPFGNVSHALVFLTLAESFLRAQRLPLADPNL